MNNKYFQKKLIPNYLTIFRIVLVPAIIVLLLVTCNKTLYSFNIGNAYYSFSLAFFIAGILFVIASLSDTLDGYLARKYNWVSEWGKIWDPIADKVLVNSVIIVFACQELVPVWVPILFIARDTIVDAYRMGAVKSGKSVAANIWGKLKTITQMFAIVVIFFIFNSQTDWFSCWQYWILQNGLILVSCFFSLLSGGIYIYRLKK